VDYRGVGANKNSNRQPGPFNKGRKALRKFEIVGERGFREYLN
jgi:hypothetical protein